MKLNKEQQKIMDEIFNMLSISSSIMEWEITIPVGFSEHKNQNNSEYLKNTFIELIGQGRYSKGEDRTCCKILFGEKKVLFKDKQEIVLNYKYASIILTMILNYINAIAFTITTREKIFPKGGPKYICITKDNK